MFEHFPANGPSVQIEDSKAKSLMSAISNQWENEDTDHGTLYMAVYDWAFTTSARGVELHIPKLKTGGSIPLNKIATDKFGFEIYGDCFLKL